MKTAKDPATGQFLKGNNYGGGRKKGSHDKLTYLIRCTTAEERESLVRSTFERALAGDMAYTKMIWDCFPSAPYERYIKHATLKDIKTEVQIDKAMEETLSLVGAGELSLEEGLDVTTLIEKRGISILRQEIHKIEHEMAEFAR